MIVGMRLFPIAALAERDAASVSSGVALAAVAVVVLIPALQVGQSGGTEVHRIGCRILGLRFLIGRPLILHVLRSVDRTHAGDWRNRHFELSPFSLSLSGYSLDFSTVFSTEFDPVHG